MEKNLDFFSKMLKSGQMNRLIESHLERDLTRRWYSSRVQGNLEKLLLQG